MKKISLYFLLLFVVVLQSCQKDIVGEESIISTEVPEPVITVATGISGIVIDENGDPLEGVVVNISRKNYETDENGYFIIIDTKASSDGGYLTFKKEGYFEGYKFAIPEAGATTFLKIKMIEKKASGSFTASEGGRIELEGGATIEFPSEAIINENETPYAGEVTVYAHWYNPVASDLTQTMPGDLRGLSADRKLVQLSTFGMMAVELEGANGEALNLNPDNLASLIFPVPDSIRFTAPATIPMWSFDEAIGHWREETVAEYSEAKYFARVSHFSFWNCDVPYPLVNIFGKLVDTRGNSLPHYWICIEAPDLGVTGYGWTNSDGGFNGKVPKDENLILKVKNECGEVLLTREIGPFSMDASFGEIEVDVTDQLLITGQLQCNGEPVSNGYVKVVVGPNEFGIFETDNDGNFEAYVVNCKREDLILTGIDRDNNRTSAPIELTDWQDADISVGIVQVCDEIEDPDIFIRYKINGSEEYLNLEPHALQTNSNNTLALYTECWDTDGDGINDPAEDSNRDGSFDYRDCGTLNPDISNIVIVLERDDPTIPYTPASIQATLFNDGNPLVFECDSLTCGNIVVEFSEFGDFVAGTFMGEDGAGNSLMGSFRIPVEIENQQSIVCSASGVDTQCGLTNGSASVSVTGGSGNYSYLWSIGATGQTISGLAAGSYEVTVADSSTGQMTSCSVVIDESISLEIETSWTDATCGLENGTATVEVLSGTAPYSYSWSNGATTSEIINLAVREYTVIVTDNEGCTSSQSVTIESLDSDLVCDIISQDASCFPGTAQVIVSGGSGNYDYQWDNGSQQEVIVDLTEGDYSVTVTDRADGCQTTCEVVIEQIDPFRVALRGPDTPLCDETQFFIEAVTFGGVPPFTYSWSNGDEERIIVGVNPGTYSVTVTDQQGCTTEESAFIAFPGNPDLDLQFESSFDGCDQNGAPFGTITAIPIEANPPVTYLWSNGSTDQTIEVEGIGSVHEVTITDALGCEIINEFQYDADSSYQTISGFAWLDSDFSGIQNVWDAQDTVLQGMTISLVDASNFNNVLASMITDDRGFYSFNVPQSGNYVLRVEENQPSIGNFIIVDYQIGNDPTRYNQFTQDFVTEELEYDGCKLEWINLGIKL